MPKLCFSFSRSESVTRCIEELFDYKFFFEKSIIVAPLFAISTKLLLISASSLYSAIDILLGLSFTYLPEPISPL